LNADCNAEKAYLVFGSSERLVKRIMYVSGKYRLVFEGNVDRTQYSYDEILYMIRKEGWKYVNEV